MKESFARPPERQAADDILMRKSFKSNVDHISEMEGDADSFLMIARIIKRDYHQLRLPRSVKYEI